MWSGNILIPFRILSKMTRERQRKRKILFNFLLGALNAQGGTHVKFSSRSFIFRRVGKKRRKKSYSREALGKIGENKYGRKKKRKIVSNPLVPSYDGLI